MLPRSALRALPACLMLLLGACTASGGGTPAASTAASAVAQAQLPAQAQDTLKLIDAGGPFPYAKDGAVFGNFEGLLPSRPRGYYHE